MRAGKRVFWTFSVKEAEAFAGYLEHMAAQGWYLERIGQYSMRFCPGEPRRLRYAAAVVPGVSVLEDGDLGQIRGQQERCRAAGWEFCCRGAWWQIFFTEDPERSVPEGLRPERQLEVRQEMQKRFLFSPFVIVDILIVMALLAEHIGRILEDPAGSLSSNEMLLRLLLELWLVLLAGGYLISSGVWYWQAGGALGRSRIAGRMDWRRIVPRRRWGAAILLCGLAGSGIFCVWKRESLFIPLFFAMMLAFSGILSWLRKKGRGAKKQFAAYVVSCGLIGVCFFAGGWTFFCAGSSWRDAAKGDGGEGGFPAVFSQLGYEADEGYGQSQESLIAFYQRGTGWKEDGEGETSLLMMEYLECPVPGGIRLARKHYSETKGNTWRIVETELPWETEEITVVRCRFELLDLHRGVWPMEDYDCYLIMDGSPAPGAPLF